LKNWIKSTVVAISLLLIVGNRLPTAQGCVDWSVEDEYFHGMTFIQSDLSQDALFKQYYYDAHAYRSELAIDQAILDTKSTQNLQEWERFFGKSLSRPELKKLVYAMPAAELAQLLKNPAAAGNQLSGAQNRPALEYLLFAKQCEPYVVALQSDWEDEYAAMKKRRNPVAMQKMIDLAVAGYGKVDAAFLKARYAYQAIRLANYAGFNQKCIHYYDQLMAPLNQSSIVAAWAWRLKNGALRKCGREAEALVETSLLFDQNPYLMDEAFLDFHIPPEALWEQCLQSAGPKHRQATLWLLRGLKEARLTVTPLQKMYQLEPRTSRLEMLLVRYVNRLEQAYFASYLFFKPVNPEAAEQKATALKYCRDLQRLLATVDRGKVHDPALWDCIAAYLQTVSQNYQAADRFLAKAGSRPTKNNIVKKQVELLKALNAIARNATVTPALEDYCYPALSGLEGAHRNTGNNLARIHDFFFTLLAQKYLSNNNYPKGYCCLAKASSNDGMYLLNYPSNQELDSLLRFFVKQDRTAYEKLLTAGQPWKLDDLYSVKGTQLLRQGNWQGAYACFSKIAPSFWAQQKKNESGCYAGLIRTSFERSYYNPRTGLYAEPKQGFPSYTKLEFVRNVLRLEKLAARNPTRADQYYYQIANGFFHSPYWACNENIDEYLIYTGVNDNYQYYPFEFQDFAKRLQQRLGNQYASVGVRKTALRYYVKAMRASQNKEFAARCCFLAQACMTEFAHYRRFRETGKSKFYYFDLLRQQYHNTEYFKNCLKECGTLKQYLNSK
jgi:hypothetical protein